MFVTPPLQNKLNSKSLCLSNSVLPLSPFLIILFGKANGDIPLRCLIRPANFLEKSVPQAVMRRVMRELNELEKSPPEGIRMQMNDEDMLDVTGIIAGPGQ